MIMTMIMIMIVIFLNNLLNHTTYNTKVIIQYLRYLQKKTYVTLHCNCIPTSLTKQYVKVITMLTIQNMRD